MDREFWKLAGQKFVENLLSVKVWTIFALLLVSTILVWNGKMDGGTFAAVNGGVISTVYALREGFKINKIRAMKDSNDIKNMKV